MIKKPALTVFHGGKDKTEARQLSGQVQNHFGFEKKYRTELDGSVTMYATKGGRPELTKIRSGDSSSELPAGVLVQVSNETKMLSNPVVFKVDIDRPFQLAHVSPPQGVPSSYAISANTIGGVVANGIAYWMVGAWRIQAGRAWWKKWWKNAVSIPGVYVIPLLAVEDANKKYLVNELGVYELAAKPVVEMSVPKRQWLSVNGAAQFKLLPPQVLQKHDFAILRCWDLQSFKDRDNSTITDSSFYVHTEIVKFPGLVVDKHDDSCCVDFGPIADPSAQRNDDPSTAPEIYNALMVMEGADNVAGEMCPVPFTYAGDSTPRWEPNYYSTLTSQAFIGTCNLQQSVRRDSSGSGVRMLEKETGIGWVGGVAPVQALLVSYDAYSGPYELIQRYIDSSTYGAKALTQYMYTQVDAAGDAVRVTEHVDVGFGETATSRISVKAGGFNVPLFQLHGASTATATKFNQTKTKEGSVGFIHYWGGGHPIAGKDLYDQLWSPDMAAAGSHWPFELKPNGQKFDTTMPYHWEEVDSWPVVNGIHALVETKTTESEYTSRMNYTAEGRYILAMDPDLEFVATIRCAVSFEIVETSTPLTKWKWVIPDESSVGKRAHNVVVSLVVQHRGMDFEQVLFSGVVLTKPNISYSYISNPYYFIWAAKGVSAMGQITADGADVVAKYMLPDYRPQPSWFASLDRVFHHQGVNPVMAGYTAADGISDRTVVASQRVKLADLPVVDWLLTWAKIDAPISDNPDDSNPANHRRYGNCDALYTLFAESYIQYEYDTTGLRLWVDDVPLTAGAQTQENRHANCYRV